MSTCLRAEDSAQPVPTDGKCPVSADKQWSPSERFVWEHVCVGEDADFNKGADYGGDFDPRKPEGLPASRTLRSSFIETILLKDKYRRVLTRYGVRIIGARFAKMMDLSGADLGHLLSFENCLFEQHIDLSNLRSTRAISFDGSKVRGLLNLLNARIAGLYMRDKAEFNTVALAGARVEGELDLSSSKVSGTLEMAGLHVGTHLYMNENAEFQDVILSAARVGGYMHLSESRVAGTLNMDGIQVGVDLRMRDGAQFHDVSLSASQTGGVIDMSGSKVIGMLNISEIQVGTSLLMRDGAEFAEVQLTNTRVNGNVEMIASKVTGTLNMNGIQIGASLMGSAATFKAIQLGGAHIAKIIDLSGATLAQSLKGAELIVDGDVWLKHGKFAGMIDLHLARVKGNMDLTNGEFDDINLSGAQIDGGLSLDAAAWSKNATLVLRNARADLIPSLADAWPSNLSLDGFIYRSVGVADRFEDWFGKVHAYAAQPYTQLAAVVQAQGNSELATAIRYAGRDRERRGLTGWPRIWLTILWASIGYGYHLERALIWVGVFLVAGTVFLQLFEQSWRNGLRSWPDKIVFSIDMLLPIIKLREKDYKIDLNGSLAYYFYFHKIMGYVLASFLIAGLSGLTK